MANQGKHKKSPVREWLDGDESTVPTQSRGSHLVDSYIKKNKPTVRKFRTAVAAAAPVEPDSLRMRDPGPAPKAARKALSSHFPGTPAESRADAATPGPAINTETAERGDRAISCMR